MPTKKTTIATPKKLRSLEMMSDGRGGKFNFRFDQLSIPEGYNPRTEFEGLDELGESIMLHGLQVSLIVERDKDSEIIWVLDGERRYRAIEKLIAKGLDPGLITCVPRPRNTSALDRDLIPLIANSGRPLTLLEKGRHYRHLIDSYGIKPADIARSTQTSKQAVSDALCIVDQGSPAVIKAVAKGLLASTTAKEIIKQAGADHAAQDNLLAAATATATATGASHITPKHIPEAEKEEPKEGAEQDPKSTINNHQSSTPPPEFTLYQIPDAPTVPLDDDTQHETDRLVLTHPPRGITLLHLLAAPTPDGLAFGFRLNVNSSLDSGVSASGLSTEYLPDPNMDSYGMEVCDGLRYSLDEAIKEASTYDVILSEGEQEALYDALHQAFGKWYPAIGDPEDAETLAFTDTSEPPAQEDASTGYKGILNAPSSNRDGSAPGKCSGGFSAPDKQMEKLEALLDDLDKKDKGNPDRITTTEIILAFLRNERTPADLRKHLEGK